MNTDVVIVDDDAVVLFLHKTLVKRSTLSSSLYCFDNGFDAYSFLCSRNSFKPIIVLLDINMPNMSGWEFLDKLASDGCDQNVWVVMVTSSINSSDRAKAQNYPNIIDYLEKPLSKEACEDLHIRVRDYLNPSGM